MQKNLNTIYSHIRQFLLRKQPALLSIVEWFLLSMVIALCVGSACAFFLISLEKATDFRNAHSWIIYFLLCSDVICPGGGAGVLDGVVPVPRHPDRTVQRLAARDT